jgi:glycosyltransferase involved in cell wall biosynthesis
MNICILTNTLLSGGAEKQAVLLAKSLAINYNIFLVVIYGDQIEKENIIPLQNTNVQVLALKGNLVFKTIKLYRIFQKNNIELVFAFLATANLLAGVIGSIAKVRYKVGGMRSAIIPKRKIFINKLLQNYINNYTIYNNYSALEFTSQRGFDNSRVRVLENGIELYDHYLRRKPKDTIEILSVGRFDASKDYETALKCISKILRNKDNITFNLVGWGKLEKQIEEWIKTLGLERNVKVIIKPKNLYELYQSADIFLQTSIFEGLSNTIMEAMNYSLPVVCTNVGDNARLIQNNYSGFVISPGEVQNITEKLLQLIDNYELRISMGYNSYCHLKSSYSMDIFTKKYLRFIQEIQIDKVLV